MKPRYSQDILTWRAKKRQERRLRALKHYRQIAVEILMGLALVASGYIMAVLVMSL